MRVLLAASIFTLVLTSTNGDAHAATIRGTVRDKVGSPGRPVANASVLVWRHGGAWQTTVRSGPDGYYETYAPPGVYNICSNKPDQPGHFLDLESVEKVNVIAIGKIVVNFDLPARSLVGLEASGARHAPIANAWTGHGGAAVVGTPADNGGGRHVHGWGQVWIQDFRGGSAGDGALLYLPGAATAWWVKGAAWAAYLVAGGAEGPLGAPLGDEASGKQSFENGSLERQPDGSWAVKGVFIPPPALGRVAIDGNAIFAADGSQAIDVDAIASLGAKVVRVNFIAGPWSGPDDTTLHQGRTWQQAVDAVIDGLRAKGILVYGLLNDELTGGGDFLRDQSDPQRARAWVESFADACTTVVGRLRGRVAVFELVNEPNDWAGQTRARVAPYWQALILKRVYERVKLDHAGDPSWQVTLVSGAILSLHGVHGDDYLAAVYKEGRAHHGWDALRARAGRFPLDGVGYHIYDAQDPNDPPSAVAGAFKPHLDAISAALKANDPEAATKKLWVSEWGWRSELGGEKHQADKMQAGFDALLGDARVGCAIYFCSFDWPGESWGVFDLSKKRKLAADTFKTNANR